MSYKIIKQWAIANGLGTPTLAQSNMLEMKLVEEYSAVASARAFATRVVDTVEGKSDKINGHSLDAVIVDELAHIQASPLPPEKPGLTPTSAAAKALVHGVKV